MKMLFVGPPGVGKGTQAKILSKRLGIPHISSGDLLRSHVAKETSLGLRAKAHMERGELVPHITGMIEYRLDKNDCLNGYILDGYPRSVANAKKLGNIAPFDIVISLVASDKVIINRLLSRGREDDTEETVTERLRVFKEETAPLIDYYVEKGLLVSIDGSGIPDEVALVISEAINSRTPKITFANDTVVAALGPYVDTLLDKLADATGHSGIRCAFVSDRNRVGDFLDIFEDGEGKATFDSPENEKIIAKIMSELGVVVNYDDYVYDIALRLKKKD